MGSLFLVRHSTTAASAAGRNLGQRTDSPLTAEGEARAARLGVTIAAELRELPHDELRLVSSPALRCRQTAEAIVEGLGSDAGAGIEVEVAAGLIEIDYGAWEGLSAEECLARDPELRRRWLDDPYRTSCPGGESGSDVAARAFAVLEPIETWLADDRSRCAIVVAHNHVLRLRLCALLGWPMHAYSDRIAQDPAGYSLVTFGRASPVVRRVNASPA